MVELSGDLNISTGPHELDTSERARRHNTSAMTGLSAVAIAHRLRPRLRDRDKQSLRYDLSFHVTNFAVGNRGTPKTKI